MKRKRKIKTWGKQQHLWPEILDITQEKETLSPSQLLASESVHSAKLRYLKHKPFSLMSMWIISLQLFFMHAIYWLHTFLVALLPWIIFCAPSRMYPQLENPSENRKPFSSLQVKGNSPHLYRPDSYLYLCKGTCYFLCGCDQFLHKPHLLYWTVNSLRVSLLLDLFLHLQGRAKYSSVDE